MTKDEFYSYLDELTSETGYDFDKVQKAFAYQAAKHYHEMQVKNCSIPAAMGELTCDSCGYHPNVIYTTSKGRFCESCKPAN